MIAVNLTRVNLVNPRQTFAIDFSARRARAGYQWHGAMLTDCLPAGWTQAAGEPVSIEPLRDMAAFRTFAELPLTRDAIQAFAGRYGLLGVEKTPIAGPELPPFATGEHVAYWRTEILSLRAAVKLAEALRAEDVSALKQIVRWDSDAACPMVRHLTLENGVLVEGDACNPRDHGVPVNQGDVVAAGWTLLLEWMMRRLAHVGIAGRWAPRGVVLHVRPRRLLDALWLQFARGVTGEFVYQQCANPRCGHWFEKRATSTKRIYCDNGASCKVIRCRIEDEKRKRAAEMRTYSVAGGSRG
jgi:hypothetical protein